MFVFVYVFVYVYAFVYVYVYVPVIVYVFVHVFFFPNSEALGFQSLNKAVCSQFWLEIAPGEKNDSYGRKQSARWQRPFSETRLSLHYDIFGALKPEYHYTTNIWTRTRS